MKKQPIMKKILLTAIAIFALGIPGTKATNLTVVTAEAVPSIQKEVKAYMNVDEFNEIVLDLVASVKFVQSDRSYIEAKGPERLIKRTDVDVKGGVMTVAFEKGENIKFRRGEKLQITIYSPSITRLEFKGVVNFKAPETIETPILEIVSDGVGNINFSDLQCKKVIVSSEGVGNITLKGNTDSAVYKSDGVGTIYAYEMISKVTNVSLNGVGGVQCYASEQGDFINNGIGNISYQGDPKEEHINSPGIGKVRKK